MFLIRFLLLLYLQKTGGTIEVIAPLICRARMGTDVDIPCTFTVKNSSIDPKILNIFWHFQDKEILSVKNSTVFATDPRMSYVDRVEDGVANLSISNINIKDGGIYRCSILYSSQRKQKDIRVYIQAPPQITITDRMVSPNKETVLHSAISGFYPVDFDIKWFRDGEILNNFLVGTPRRNLDGTYSVNSSVTITPTKEDRERIFSCRVQHESLTTPLQEDFKLVYDLKAQYKKFVIFASPLLVTILGLLTIGVLHSKRKKKRFPKVRDITRSPGGIFSLDVDHFFPEAINVSWKVIQPPSSTEPRPIDSTILRQQNQDGTFNATSTCESLRGVIREDEPYSVRAVVEHNKMKHPKQREWRNDEKDSKGFLARPDVEMIQMPKLFFDKQTQLRCRMSHFYPDKLTVDWFNKENGKDELNYIVNNDKYKVPNSRSQLQTDKTFTYTALLEFTPSIEDHGSEVICRVSHPSLAEPIERTTGPLHVLARPDVQQPIQLLINDSGDMVTSFSLLRFYPKDLRMIWTYGQTQEKQASDAISENPDGTYSVTSQCTIPANLFENPQFRVRVTWDHPSMESEDYRELSVQDSDFPWWPKIIGITPLILQLNQKTTVRCTISGYFSKNLRVTWIEKKGDAVTDCTQNRHNYHIPDIRHERMADNSYQCSPSLSFTPISDKEDLEFICRVEHPSLEHPIERSTGPARVNVAPKQKDVKFTIVGSDQVQCSLSLLSFFPKNINITWSHKEQSNTTLSSTKKIIQTNDEEIFDAISECIVPWKSFKSSIRVTWKHESLTQPEYQILCITDLPWQPHIEELDSSDIKLNTKSKIQCKMSGYFPDNLTARWYYKKAGMNDFVPVTENKKFSVPGIKHQRQSDNTYSCTAILQFTPTLKEDQGSEFKCRVQHPNLEQPIEKKSGCLKLIESKG
ncbi:uncharacterized protein [Aquarana catesbeiana]|uniref:uncharacterized protein n=1 Tax=Aquarana catesbeiana TaxID=8400 RepID=UPI003CC9AE76